MSWPVRQLEHVCSIVAGQSPPSETYNKNQEGLPFFQGKADFGELYPTVRTWCSKPNKVAEPNDILISVRAPVGATNICNVTACIGRGLAAIKPSEKVDQKYLLYYFRYFEPILSQSGNGAIFSAITMSDLKGLQIPLPPLPIQKKIAVVLEKADELRRKREEQIKRLDDLLQATFLDMFGDPVTNPKGWPEKKLGEIISFITSGSRGWARYYSDSGRLFLRIQNVKDAKLKLDDIAYVEAPDTQEAKRTLVKPGDVLISITADLGRTAVIPDDLPPAHINQHLALIRPEKKIVNPVYLASFLESKGGKTQFFKANKAAVKAGLNFDDIKSIEVLLPPSELQEKFFRQKREIEVQQEHLQKINISMELLFNSLMQRAFKGELGLK